MAKLSKFDIKNLKSMSKEETIERIINQANALNRKIPKFRNEGITEHMDYIKAMLGNDVMYTQDGRVTKSKALYNNKHVFQLKKILNSLHKLNNHEVYGTVKKFNDKVTRQMRDIADFTRNYLSEKGYSEQLIETILADKKFYDKVFTRFNEGLKGYGSDQVIHSYAEMYKPRKDREKILSDIEHSINEKKRIDDEKREFEEYKRNKGMR